MISDLEGLYPIIIPGGKPITSHQLRKIAKNWGNWSGLVVFYLIIADLMSIKI